MYIGDFYSFVLMGGTVAGVVIGLVLMILLGRFILVATQALRTYISTEDIKMNLLLADPAEDSVGR